MRKISLREIGVFDKTFKDPDVMKCFLRALKETDIMAEWEINRVRYVIGNPDSAFWINDKYVDPYSLLVSMKTSFPPLGTEDFWIKKRCEVFEKYYRKPL